MAWGDLHAKTERPAPRLTQDIAMDRALERVTRVEVHPASPKAAHEHEINVIYQPLSANTELPDYALDAITARLAKAGIELAPTKSTHPSVPRYKVLSEHRGLDLINTVRGINRELEDKRAAARAAGPTP